MTWKKQNINNIYYNFLRISWVTSVHFVIDKWCLVGQVLHEAMQCNAFSKSIYGEYKLACEKMDSAVVVVTLEITVVTSWRNVI